jgi:hypothetical protein
MEPLQQIKNARFELRAEAVALAGGAADIHRRCEALREIEADSNGNMLFPAIALRDRDVFVAFYTDYYLSKRFGHLPGAPDLVDPCLLHMLNRVHEAAANGVLLPQPERRAFYATASAIYGEANNGISAAAC